jgi:hypothetical protein
VGWLFSLIVSAVLAVAGWFARRKVSTEERLGAEEAANVSLRAGQDAIRRANEAAKKVDPNAKDPNDLDSRP